jgi:hypothetical protein
MAACSSGSNSTINLSGPGNSGEPGLMAFSSLSSPGCAEGREASHASPPSNNAPTTATAMKMARREPSGASPRRSNEDIGTASGGCSVRTAPRPSPDNACETAPASGDDCVSATSPAIDSDPPQCGQRSCPSPTFLPQCWQSLTFPPRKRFRF